jgi:TctA family transporter
MINADCMISGRGEAEEWVVAFRHERHQRRRRVAASGTDGAAAAHRRARPLSPSPVCAVASVLLAGAADFNLGRTPPSSVEEILWCLAVSLPLAFRRRAPLVVLVVVAAAFIGLQARYVAETQLSSVCLFLALFTAGAWAVDRTMARVVRLVVVIVMFAWLAYVLSATAWAEQFQGKGRPASSCRRRRRP